MIRPVSSTTARPTASVPSARLRRADAAWRTSSWRANRSPTDVGDVGDVGDVDSAPSVAEAARAFAAGARTRDATGRGRRDGCALMTGQLSHAWTGSAAVPMYR